MTKKLVNSRKKSKKFLNYWFYYKKII